MDAHQHRPWAPLPDSFFDKMAGRAKHDLKTIWGDPLVVEYVRQLSMAVDAGRKWCIRDALGVLGERAVNAAMLMQGGYQGSFERNGVWAPGSTDRDHAALQISLGMALLRATPYLWLEGMFITAAGTAVPRHIVSTDVLPHALMYWTFENALGTSRGQSPEAGMWIDAMMVGGDAQGIFCYHIGTERAPGAEDSPTMTFQRLDYGHRFPDDLDPMAVESAAQILAALSFLASPHIPKATHRVDGKLRRSLERGGSSPSLDDVVTFVDLRPVAGVAKTSSDHGIEYHHRRLVRGHHRAQWYPSQQAHKLIWIAPHIKGPGDAPFKDTVYRVVR